MDYSVPDTPSQTLIQALRQRLLCANIEMETLRTNAMNELRLKEDCVNQLHRLLKQTTFERDEARRHLQHLLLSKPPSLHIPITSPVDSSAAPFDHLHRPMNPRPLPEMGGLMQAVADAGPLLKTLFVAGQTVQTPPAVGMRGRKRPPMWGLGPDAKRLLKQRH
ncbi:hypothetical protein QJS04_geneDACA019990 [Acorus gramineus]|uniref:Uncharacterized protein n=1 Tax=Acorus gramineus TaxID=55184 RepID=A0AAV9B616_ACOGR|nr:hypothetical protein QJS04_geneDACA019990 [Acorus gramineus]